MTTKKIRLTKLDSNNCDLCPSIYNISTENSIQFTNESKSTENIAKPLNESKYIPICSTNTYQSNPTKEQLLQLNMFKEGQTKDAFINVLIRSLWNDEKIKNLKSCNLPTEPTKEFIEQLMKQLQ